MDDDDLLALLQEQEQIMMDPAFRREFEDWLDRLDQERKAELEKRYADQDE